MTFLSFFLRTTRFPFGITVTTIYQSKWLIDKNFLFKKSNKGLSLAWIQELKKYYQKEGFSQGVAYIDDWNKGVLKSVLRAGYKIDNWT